MLKRNAGKKYRTDQAKKVIRNKDEVKIATDTHTYTRVHTKTEIEMDATNIAVSLVFVFVLIFAYHIIHYISRLSNARPNIYILHSVKLFVGACCTYSI